MPKTTVTLRPMFEQMAQDLKNERYAGDLFSEAKARLARQEAITEGAKQIGELRAALRTVLDCVDYRATPPNCRSNEMVGAVLPPAVIDLARKALK